MDPVIVASKAVLLLLSLAFWAVAIVLIGFGVYSIYVNSSVEYHDDYLFEVNHYSALYYFLIIGLGVVLFLIGCTGLWSICSGNYFGLELFKNVTQFFFLVELGIFISAIYTLAKGLNNSAFKINAIMQKYDGYNAESLSVDYGQRQLQCCGVQGYFDWEFTPWFSDAANNSVPLSCCVHPRNCTGSVEEPWNLFTEVFGKLSVAQIRNRDYNYVRLH
ncbi:tetraspanin-36-like isoform X2 [Ambystoma mexicanum]|uniref:tetraspanin-36-like isoform X2 n=1 Tax=Ambystoma mexicanum TaxID=8296 RepID=UPI0037E968FE